MALSRKFLKKTKLVALQSVSVVDYCTQQVNKNSMFHFDILD